jgi:arylsulfatase A-like enzyme
MLMSGQYPLTNTVCGNINSHPKRPYDLPDDRRCITDVLSDSGYHVGYIGKWHLTRPHEPYIKATENKQPVWNEFTPKSRRHSIDYWYAYNTYDDHLHPMYWDNDAGRDEYHFVDQWSVEHETDKAIEYLNQRVKTGTEKPFALFLSYNPPHPPFGEVPQKYKQLYKDATPDQLLTRGNVDLSLKTRNTTYACGAVDDYFAAISGVDDQFGRLLAALNHLGLDDNTLVVFTSDHGEMMGSHDMMGKIVWQAESFSVPMIMRLPGRLAAGSTDDLLYNTPDIPATLLGLLQLQDRLPAGWQGVNYAQTLMHPGQGRRPEAHFYCNCYTDIRGARDTHYSCIVAGKRSDGQTFPQLYDRREDPYQLHNIAADHSKLVAEYQQQILTWCRHINDPVKL